MIAAGRSSVTGFKKAGRLPIVKPGGITGTGDVADVWF
jgi:hypothetical protein